MTFAIVGKTLSVTAELMSANMHFGASSGERHFRFRRFFHPEHIYFFKLFHFFKVKILPD